MTHPIADHDIPGIAEGRRVRLEAAGILTLEDLVQAGVDAVCAVPHIPRPVAEKAIAAASDLLLTLTRPTAEVASPTAEVAPPAAEVAPENAPAPAPVIEAVIEEVVPPPMAASASVDKAVGKSARLLKDAEKHAKKGPRSEGKKARREFGRLRGSLKEVRRLAEAGALTETGWNALKEGLKDLNGSLKRLLRRGPKEDTLKKSRKKARDLRQDVEI